jgi:thymidylate synthase ThyX
MNALEILLLTKSTRLKGVELEDVIRMPMQEKLHHFEYMKDTIKSSFEFCTYIFIIKDVSRNFTHQLVRTRTQSYAQESMRAVNKNDAEFYNYGLCDEYDNAVDFALENYNQMIETGINIQDARGVLPTDTLTDIMVRTDLRTIHETAKVRLCFRTAGEYQEVFKEMRRLIGEVHPWVLDMINVACVDSGICCFPRYTECPVQASTVKIDDFRKLAIKIAWENSSHVANPIAKNGSTM